ncbi:MAG: 23S rRNA (uracil(1939)-C(5))-methyltransferase RlmD [Armatimonadota bacterium]|nr:23S rRNA (uracil(1939)-C(5))-methyltransferase RlmD [Armatimonadota bacterium]MDR7439323.1 23S rRNA (uracil(1939)-C(5))-methyltransferase RlmD [Armatimonadota bacterium]MDR7562013.1 23S rRNA (uracil(1939)-C(5))-methyltransferase RlmD [Armatimonadota bacterium]MDR7567013.1 23S rRNA (uracil(1939)-C(5))-methyltransferase RlmD [Armatimonadota bacterium]MDR7602749.1 23S rRNA (uracil(1939)-C(5))-methyltransferase RlmD [Armatimonadota bacterium]
MAGFQKGQELDLHIDRLSYGGRGVGRVDGYVVFVPHTAPGDLVRARITRAKRTFAEAELVAVLEPGPDRTLPPCPYFGPCGGCSWQHLDYPAQLRIKEQIVLESLERLGGLRDLPLRPILPAPEPYHYRNKMEFAFHPEAILGLHPRGQFDRVLGIERCLLPSPVVSEILQAVRTFVRTHRIPCYDNRTRTGRLRHLVVREGRRIGEILVGIVTTPGEFPEGKALAEALASRFPQIRGVVWVQSSALSDAVRVDALEVLWGRDFIEEELSGFRFCIRLETFFQTNTEAAERLVRIALEVLDLRGDETVVDLYCGVGTFTLPLAVRARAIYGIEVVPEAVEAARENARRAGISNAEFLVGDVRLALPELVRRIGPPDVLVLDPPRAGAGGRVMRKIGRSGARRILYVSCNPTTLAPDLKELLPFGYAIRTVQPVDLFPQTYHVETVVLLEQS